MIRPKQILAEAQSPALTDEQVMNLLILVRAYPPYAQAVGRWPDFPGLLAAEQETPTVKTRAYKAILTALDALPKEVVESAGTEDAPGHFTTPSNWAALALDALNIAFDVPIISGNQQFALAQPSHEDLRAPEGDWIILF